MDTGAIALIVPAAILVIALVLYLGPLLVTSKGLLWVKKLPLWIKKYGYLLLIPLGMLSIWLVVILFRRKTSSNYQAHFSEVAEASRKAIRDMSNDMALKSALAGAELAKVRLEQKAKSAEGWADYRNFEVEIDQALRLGDPEARRKRLLELARSQ